MTIIPTSTVTLLLLSFPQKQSQNNLPPPPFLLIANLWIILSQLINLPQPVCVRRKNFSPIRKLNTWRECGVRVGKTNFISHFTKPPPVAEEGAKFLWQHHPPHAATPRWLPRKKSARETLHRKSLGQGGRVFFDELFFRTQSGPHSRRGVVTSKV